MLAPMTTTAHSFWALGDYDRIAELVADLGTEVVAAAGVGPGTRVLDVGTGTGNAALPAAAAGAEVVATDITPELLAVGERHARDRGLGGAVAGRGRAGAAVRRRRSFDVVLSCSRCDVRPGPRHDGPRAAAGVPPRRNGGDGQLDAGGRRRALLPPPRPLRPPAGRRPVTDGMGRCSTRRGPVRGG